MQRPTSQNGDSEGDERSYLLASSSGQEEASDNIIVASVASQSVGSDTDIPASIRWINFILGAAILLPWNAIITALPYFLSRLTGSILQSTFSSYLSVTFTLAHLIFMGHSTIIASQQGKSSWIIRCTLIIVTLLNLILTLSTFVTLPPAFFFASVIINGMLQASAGSYLQSSVVAVASLFGPLAIQPVMSGQAAVGVLVSFIQVLTTLAGIRRKGDNQLTPVEGDEATAARAAFLFFASSTLFLLITMGLHSWLLTMSAFKSVVDPYEASKDVIRIDEGRDDDALAPVRLDHMLKVGKLNWEYNAAITLVFVVTLSVFPPITSSIQSVHYPPTTLFTHPLLFTSIHFLLFNIGDLIGRYLPMARQFQVWSGMSLLYMSIGRTLFIPLFLVCNVQNPSSPFSAAPVGMINSDILFFIILFSFGLSNGYISSLVMMAAPSMMHNSRLKNHPEDVDTSATIASFFAVFGLVIGSFMSFGVKGLLCTCNPFISG